jgi:hypothetical protein
LPVSWLAGLRGGDVLIVGFRVRVMPCCGLTHDIPPLSAVCRADLHYLPGATTP